MTTNNIYISIDDLKNDGWEYTIRYDQIEKYTIVIWKPEWTTSDFYKARICPMGRGEDLNEAFVNLLDNSIYIRSKSNNNQL